MNPDSRGGRAVQAMARSKPFLRFGPRVVPTFDRWTHKLTGGRFMFTQLMVPTLTLTTIGRKTGTPRSVPLATIPLDHDLYVVGSNWAGVHHPAWALNLEADPSARVVFRGTDFATEAHELDSEEKKAVWPRLTERWPVYDFYVKQSGRDLKVFRLPLPP